MELPDQPHHVHAPPVFGQGRNFQRASQREGTITELDWRVQGRNGACDLCFAHDAAPAKIWISEATTSRVQKESVAAGKATRIASTMSRKRHQPRSENPGQRLSVTHHQQVVRHQVDISGAIGKWGVTTGSWARFIQRARGGT
jgi:hypothetical protein